jgi:hypothetical protein
MRQTFNTPLEAIDNQDRFSKRESGLKHPDIENLFVRLRDNGDLELVAGEGLAIIMHPRNRSITFIADHINFITQSDEGLRWNHVSFNSRAVSFHEPTFIAKNDEQLDAYNTYEGLDVFVSTEEDTGTMPAVTDQAGNRMTLEEYAAQKREPGIDQEEEDIEIPDEYFPC